jgi:serine/threonine protein kinase
MHGTRVAVKFPNKALMSHATDSQRLQKEILVTCTLHHPYIVHAYGITGDLAQAGECGLVLEYLPISMPSAVEARPGGAAPGSADHADCPLDVKLLWMFQIATALHHAHQRGVLHCDIKPFNMMVAGDGTARLMDFGDARVLPLSSTGAKEGDGKLRVVRANTFVGTSLYADVALLRVDQAMRAVGTELPADMTPPALASPTADRGSVDLTGKRVFAARRPVAKGPHSGAGDADTGGLLLSTGTDMFSFACTVVEILTGVKPWLAVNPARPVATEADIMALCDSGSAPFQDALLGDLQLELEATTRNADLASRLVAALRLCWHPVLELRPSALDLADLMSPAQWNIPSRSGGGGSDRDVPLHNFEQVTAAAAAFVTTFRRTRVRSNSVFDGRGILRRKSVALLSRVPSMLSRDLPEPVTKMATGAFWASGHTSIFSSTVATARPAGTGRRGSLRAESGGGSDAVVGAAASVTFSQHAAHRPAVDAPATARSHFAADDAIRRDGAASAPVAATFDHTAPVGSDSFDGDGPASAHAFAQPLSLRSPPPPPPMSAKRVQLRLKTTSHTPAAAPGDVHAEGASASTAAEGAGPAPLVAVVAEAADGSGDA